MYLRSWVASISLLTFLTVAVYLTVLRSRPEDPFNLAQLVAESTDLRTKHALERKPAIQHRIGVQKDLYSIGSTGRIHTCVTCQDSELTLYQNKGNFSAEEALHSLACVMEGEDFSCTLTSDEGRYNGQNISFIGAFHLHHPMGEIFAEKASLEGLKMKNNLSHLYLEGKVRIELPQSEGVKEAMSIRSEKAFCTLIPQSPFSLEQFQTITFQEKVSIQTEEGIAATGEEAVYEKGKITLFSTDPSHPSALSSERYQLHAGAIELVLNDEKTQPIDIRTIGPSEMEVGDSGHLSCPGPIIHNPVANTFRAKPQHPLHFYNETLDLETDSAYVDAEKGQLIVEGNVRLISSNFQGKETYAIAEKAYYSLTDRQLLLTGSSHRNVLFWQDGFCLTAPEVHIERDLEKVQGIGDVHFTFDLEEQNYFEQIFSVYL